MAKKRGLKVPQDRVEYIFNAFASGASKQEIAKGLAENYGIVQRTGYKNIEAVIAKMNADANYEDRVYWRERIASGLMKIYVDSMRECDLDALLEKMVDKELDPRKLLAIFKKFNPHASRSNAMKALSQLAELLGTNAPTKVEHTVDNAKPDPLEMSPRMRWHEIQELAKKGGFEMPQGVPVEKLN